MKNHKEMFEALLAGETLIDRRYTCKLVDAEVKFYADETEILDETDKCMWFGSVEKWSIKPKTININGFEVPEPERKALKFGQIYFIPDTDSCCHGDKGSLPREWTNNEADRGRLNLGIVHLIEEAAILHTKALLSFTRKDND